MVTSPHRVALCGVGNPTASPAQTWKGLSNVKQQEVGACTTTSSTVVRGGNETESQGLVTPTNDMQRLCVCASLPARMPSMQLAGKYAPPLAR